jgi:hypothetical protein
MTAKCIAIYFLLLQAILKDKFANPFFLLETVVYKYR